MSGYIPFRGARKRGWTELHAAALYGDIDGLKRLIAEGANIHAEDKYGWTPSDVAISKEAEKVLRAAIVEDVLRNLKLCG